MLKKYVKLYYFRHILCKKCRDFVYMGSNKMIKVP